MYTITESTGIVVRDLDQVVVSPVQDVNDPNFIEYKNWVALGNAPTVAQEDTKGNYVISTEEFRNRFIDPELSTIVQAAYAGDLTCQLLLLKIETADTINLKDPKTIAGMQYVVSINKLTAERMQEILAY